MGLLGLILPIALVVALGAWLSGLESLRRRRAVVVLGLTLASGLVLYVLLGDPSITGVERMGAGCLFALPALAAALVAFRPGLWERPWLVILLSLLAYAAGFILAMNVWIWLGLPH